ncbi:hypothetical protein IWQ60_002891 [Tieghemiomyces parasiticus]|uniref:Uncharacterized protein n=1 Tax=Tieghemiomyces parasiticus TaxID=78921 RepID=A0A9W8AIC0_9FUNG|nr:hypothetical protein IWQ60_002891 [Tieghemiomyces parasiticus]
MSCCRRLTASRHPLAVLALLTGFLLATTAAHTPPTRASRHLGPRHGTTAASDERDTSCDGRADLHDYDLALHIVALFVIFVGSSLGALMPILANRYQRLSVSPVVIECGKFFGAGVILATALIHMLPGAMLNLTDPCVPANLTQYSAFAGLFTMLAILVFHLLEHLLTGHLMRGQTHTHHPHNGYAPTTTEADPHVVVPLDGDSNSSGDNAPVKSEHHTHGMELHSQHTHVHGGAFLANSPEARRSGTYILEVGIAMHSVLIGLALGTSSGPEFVSLWVALILHQFFEGFALGSRLAELTFARITTPLLSALAFAVSTPIGIAIGMGIRTTYQPDSPTNLVVQGVLDSLSAGILLYAALVNLIAQEFSQASFFQQPNRLKALYFLSMYLGAAAMAVIGIWA